LQHSQDSEILGNTVIVVEHDEDAIRVADFVVDIGPGAGVHGGQIIASGTPQDIMGLPRIHYRAIFDWVNEKLKFQQFDTKPKTNNSLN